MAIEIVSGLCFAGAGIWARGKNIDGLVTGAICGVTGAFVTWGIMRAYEQTSADKKIQALVHICLPFLGGGAVTYYGVKMVDLSLEPRRVALIMGSALAIALVTERSGHALLRKAPDGIVNGLHAVGFNALAIGGVLIAAVVAKAFGFGK